MRENTQPLKKQNLQSKQPMGSACKVQLTVKLENETAIDIKNENFEQKSKNDLTDSMCQVCFTNDKRFPLCLSCRLLYARYKNKSEINCLAEQDCVIYHKKTGCLKCRITKTRAVIESNHT